MQNRVLKLDSKDNVLIALTDLRRGEQVSFDSQTYTLESDVPAKHKFATEDLAAGARIIMYGVLVGKAMEPIRRGGLLTTRNVHHEAAAFQEKTEEYRWTPPDVSRWKQREFLGYRRSDGQVGARNYWIVVPLVFCENRNIAVLKQAFEEELGFAAPQVYRRQVAELARLYADGRTEEIKTCDLTGGTAKTQYTHVFEKVVGGPFLFHAVGWGVFRADLHKVYARYSADFTLTDVAG